jgi:hypothetical protein
VLLVNIELVEMMGVAQFHKLLASTLDCLSMVFVEFSSLLKSRAALQLENIAFGIRLEFFNARRRNAQLSNSDRLLWIGLSRMWLE